MKKHRILTIALASAIGLSAYADHHAKKFVSIFDGKTLEGWTQLNGTATYEAKDGTIVGTTKARSPNSFLCSNKLYGDFELLFEVRVHNSLNSGVQIRSNCKKLTEKEKKRGDKYGRVNGPQVEIESSGAKGAESGYLYGEAAGGWMTPADKRKPHKHFKDGEWNKYRVLAEGARIRTWINDQPISDLVDEGKLKTHPKGFIGLQVHSIRKGSGPYDVAWRNLKIRVIKKKK